MTFNPSSRVRLTRHDLGRFPEETLFHRIARAVCEAGCLPRKELYEAWEVGRRVRRLMRGGRVVDLAGGHGMLAHVLMLLDDSSPDALVIDRVVPASAAGLQDALLRTWPRLRGRVHYEKADIGSVALRADDLIVASHACGALSDAVLAAATGVRARVAILPCCHDVDVSDTGALQGWLDPALAIDVMRAVRLERLGYHVWTQHIPAEITPKNRLLMARPPASPGSG